jgi:SAM-dependent methyltransferase
MTADAATLAFYAREAPLYADFAAKAAETPYLTKFMSLLPAGASVLDLGAGAGWGAGRMQAEGFTVLAQDASPELLAEAERRYAVPTRLARFNELDDTAAWAGIWACFSLLHAPRAAMPDILARCHRALTPGGLIYLGLKAGEGELRDTLGRLYTHYTEDEIRGLLTAAGFTGIDTRLRDGGAGYDGTPTTALHVFARRAD